VREHYAYRLEWIKGLHQIESVALRLSKLQLVHTLADVPMYVRATLVHSRELVGTSIVSRPGMDLQATDGPEKVFD